VPDLPECLAAHLFPHNAHQPLYQASTHRLVQFVKADGIPPPDMTGSSKSYSSQVFFGTGNHPFRFCLKYVPQNPMDYHHFTIKFAVWREFPIFSHIHFLGIKNFVPHPCFVCGEGFDKASWSSFTC